MKTRIAVVLVMMMSVALLFGCATSGKMDADSVRTDIALWEEVGWEDMTAAEMALWEKLGWDADSWEGEAKQPASEDKYWNQLSDEEREACGKLGYTKESWDK